MLVLVVVSAILMQEDSDGMDHPLSYFLRKFNPSQMKYSTIEKEILALLWSLQQFDVYIGSSNLPLKVYTGHNPLVFLSRIFNFKQCLMRWPLLIQDYHLVIKHQKGRDNVIADALPWNIC